jgi:hypothetical protein
MRWYELGIALSELGLILIGAGVMLGVLGIALYVYLRYAEEK